MDARKVSIGRELQRRLIARLVTAAAVTQHSGQSGEGRHARPG